MYTHALLDYCVPSPGAIGHPFFKISLSPSYIIRVTHADVHYLQHHPYSFHLIEQTRLCGCYTLDTLILSMTLFSYRSLRFSPHNSITFTRLIGSIGHSSIHTFHFAFLHILYLTITHPSNPSRSAFLELSLPTQLCFLIGSMYPPPCRHKQLIYC
jgi:hypothetical protein